MTLANNTILILHLSLIKNMGPGAILKLLGSVYRDVYPDVMHVGWIDVIERHAELPLATLYDYSIADLVKKGGLTEAVATTVHQGLADKDLLTEELDRINKYGLYIVSVLDEVYPEILKQIYAPPAILYCKGSAFDNASKRIGIVGARKATDYAHRVIKGLVPSLIYHGWHVVSGGAEGVDTMAHEATLDAGGVTVVVMGSGFSYTYPASNRKLFDRVVAQGGTIVSPFSVTTPPDRGNFPARNRIISGLSHGCVIVQAAEKSGSLITGNCALEQGRQVFAVPGLFDDELSAGCHNLIKQGAKLVSSVSDILEEFGQYSVQYVKKDEQQMLMPAIRIVESDPVLLLLDEPATLDELSEKSGFDMLELQNRLFSLQLDGKVQQNFVGLWERVET